MKRILLTVLVYICYIIFYQSAYSQISALDTLSRGGLECTQKALASLNYYNNFSPSPTKGGIAYLATDAKAYRGSLDILKGKKVEIRFTNFRPNSQYSQLDTTRIIDVYQSVDLFLYYVGLPKLITGNIHGVDYVLYTTNEYHTGGFTRNWVKDPNCVFRQTIKLFNLGSDGRYDYQDLNTVPVVLHESCSKTKQADVFKDLRFSDSRIWFSVFNPNTKDVDSKVCCPFGSTIQTRGNCESNNPSQRTINLSVPKNVVGHRVFGVFPFANTIGKDRLSKDKFIMVDHTFEFLGLGSQFEQYITPSLFPMLNDFQGAVYASTMDIQDAYGPYMFINTLEFGLGAKRIGRVDSFVGVNPVNRSNKELNIVIKPKKLMSFELQKDQKILTATVSRQRFQDVQNDIDNLPMVAEIGPDDSYARMFFTFGGSSPEISRKIFIKDVYPHLIANSGVTEQPVLISDIPEHQYISANPRVISYNKSAIVTWQEEPSMFAERMEVMWSVCERK